MTPRNRIAESLGNPAIALAAQRSRRQKLRIARLKRAAVTYLSGVCQRVLADQPTPMARPHPGTSRGELRHRQVDLETGAALR